MTKRPGRYCIRRMRVGDLAMVRAIEDISYPNPWSESTFRGEIQNTSVSFPLVVICRPENKVIGYIIYWHIRDDVQVNNLAVHPDYRRRGIGEALMKHVLEKVREAGVTIVNLEVRTSNTSAQSLYEKLGFEILGTRKDYYTNPEEDAIVMGLFLAQ